MQILDGLLVAEKIKEELKQKLARFLKQNNRVPGLRVILVGEDSASQVYVRQKIKQAEKLGIDSDACLLPKDISFKTLKQKIQEFNEDSRVQALLIQLPLPISLDRKKVLNCVDPLKDPDCLTVENQGRAWSGQPRVLPCTPAGIMRLFKHYNCELKGKKAVVIGRSQIVGLPMAQLLLRANATVTVCHSHTQNLSEFTRAADVVVVAAGRRGLLGRQDFKKGSIVVDVGVHRVDGKLEGDVRFKELDGHVAFATPVPGGVGPMTVVQLLENTLHLAELRCREQQS